MDRLFCPENIPLVCKSGETKQEVPLTVLQDPRNTAGREDLQAQYDFVQKGIDKMNDINKTIREIRKVNTQLSDLKTKTEDEDLKTEIDSLINSGNNIEKALYQTKNKSPQDPLNYPIRLNNKYGHVIVLATIGFNRPTTSMIEVEKELSSLIDTEIDKWENTKTALKELNRKIRNAEVPFIKW